MGHLWPKFGIQRVALGLAAVAIAALVLGVTKSAALGPAGSYTSIAFADGFESGDLSHWSGLLGNTNNPTEAQRYMYGHGFGLLFLAQVFGEEEDGDRRRKLEEILTRAASSRYSPRASTSRWPTAP